MSALLRPNRFDAGMNGIASEQEFDPWGAVRSGSMAATRRNFWAEPWWPAATTGRAGVSLWSPLAEARAINFQHVVLDALVQAAAVLVASGQLAEAVALPGYPRPAPVLPPHLP